MSTQFKKLTSSVWKVNNALNKRKPDIGTGIQLVNVTDSNDIANIDTHTYIYIIYIYIYIYTYNITIYIIYIYILTYKTCLQPIDNLF